MGSTIPCLISISISFVSASSQVTFIIKHSTECVTSLNKSIHIHEHTHTARCLVTETQFKIYICDIRQQWHLFTFTFREQKEKHHHISTVKMCVYAILWRPSKTFRKWISEFDGMSVINKLMATDKWWLGNPKFQFNYSAKVYGKWWAFQVWKGICCL